MEIMNSQRTQKWNPVHSQYLVQPLHWRKPRHIEVISSPSDLFDEQVTNEELDQVFAVMALCPQHIFQLLTRQPKRMLTYLNRLGPSLWESTAIKRTQTMARVPGKGWLNEGQWPLPNVQLGVIVNDQQTANERVPLLLEAPAAVKFLLLVLESCVPSPERIGLRPSDDFSDKGHGHRWLGGPSVNAARSPGIDWVRISGGPGPNSLQCSSVWFDSIVQQCREAEIPCFY